MHLPAAVLVATRSAGKLRELLPWFSARNVMAESLDEAGLPESEAENALEVFDTFEANALAKARWFHHVSGGRVVVSDDSGLEVEALADAPGVRSKRWSGRDDLDGAALDGANNGLLLAKLELAAATGLSSRRARYVCAAACVWRGGEAVVRGTTTGVIADRARGECGFGYDPYFVSDELGVTFGEATRDEKAKVSHRGRAFEQLIAVLDRMDQRAGIAIRGQDGG